MASLPGAIGENVAILGAIDPVALGAATTTSSWGSAANFHKIGAVLVLGATNGTVDMILQQATDSSGTSAKAMSPAVAMTQLGATDDNKQVVLSCDASRCMDIDNGFTHFACRVVTAGTTNVLGAVLWGAGNRYGPVASTDDAGVDEIVSV